MAIHWLAIVNPRARFARPARWRQHIAETIQREMDARVVFTEYPGHASELAASSAADGLAVFGGDGTIAEVVNGMDLPRQRLLLLAGGTGNGLVRDLGLNSLAAGFAALRVGRTQALDLIRLEFESQGRPVTRLAISTVSLGYAAETVALANRHFKSLGEFCYPLAATLQAARQQSFSVTVQLDENPPQEQYLSNIMVNNTRHAGNFSAFRNSNPADGRLEVLLARAGFAAQCLHNIAVLSRTYFYATAAEASARMLTLIPATPQRLMIDGELWDEVTHLRCEVLPGKLQCVA